MCKKKRSSASGRKPPPSTTVEQPSKPPSPEVEPIDPEIRQAIAHGIALLRSKEYDKALDFIKESISCHPFSGHLHQVEGMIHLHVADYVTEDDGAKIKHLEDGVCSVQLAVELLPNSINCASLLADLLLQLGYFSKKWDEVIEACKRGLKIENPTESGVEDLFGEDVSNESRIEDERQVIMMCLHMAETQKNVNFVENRAVEVVHTDVDINYIAVSMDRRKKQFREIMRDCGWSKPKMSSDSKKFNGDDEKIEEYKLFWSGTLSDEKKRGFRKVKIEELEKHYRRLRYDLAVDLLSEAINFCKEYKTWKFWECCDCVKKFGDYESYRIHLWEEHLMDLEWKLTSDIGIEKESIDMIVDGVWKPVDTDEMINIIVNHPKSESCSIVDSGFGTDKGLDECKSSAVGEVPGKISESDNNELSMTSVDDPKQAFCDGSERAGRLVRIRGMLDVLLRNKCLASSHVRWAIEYTKDQFESIIPLSHFRNHGKESLQILCFLGSSQLTEVLKFLEDVARNCGLSENAEIDNSMDDKLRGDHISKKVVLSREFSCLLLEDHVLTQGELNVTNYSNAVVDDGSAVASAVNESEDDVFPDSDDIVSWLIMGSNCGEALESWTSLRDFQRGQAVKFPRMFDEELSHLPTLCDARIKISSKLIAVQAVGSIILEEIKKREEISEHEPKLYLDLLKKRREELRETDDISIRTELDVISNVLEDARVLLSGDQSGSEECGVEDELRLQECTKLTDTCIKLALQRLKMQLLKDLSFLDAIILRYERELANISVYDYRSIIVPLVKSFLQPHLYDLFYKDAEEKSEAAAKALLAEVALEAETKKKKNNKVSDNMKQKQDKKKKKQKKNKNFRKTKESKATDDSSKHFELPQKGAEQNDNPNFKNDDSLDEPKPLTASDEERILDEYLENQRRFEHEASVKVKASGSRVGNEAVDDCI
ncbi:hypothetical protein ACOSP7_029048 [Xanthoceras sorbifolium]